MRPEPTREKTLNVVDALVASRRKTLDILSDSMASGDLRTALLAVQTELKQLALLAQLTGQHSDSGQVNVLLSPDYLELKRIVYVSLQDFPEARLRLSEALSGVSDEPSN